MTYEELARDMKLKIKRALITGPTMEINQNLDRLLDEYEKRFIDLFNHFTAMEAEGLDETPIFPQDQTE